MATSATLTGPEWAAFYRRCVRLGHAAVGHAGRPARAYTAALRHRFRDPARAQQAAATAAEDTDGSGDALRARLRRTLVFLGNAAWAGARRRAQPRREPGAPRGRGSDETGTELRLLLGLLQVEARQTKALSRVRYDAAGEEPVQRRRRGPQYEDPLPGMYGAAVAAVNRTLNVWL